ncbi:hypothetical protein CRUP_021655, partial [Coryphaenoides rupestris]
MKTLNLHLKLSRASGEEPAAPSPSQLSRSPRSAALLPGAARVLPPIGGKDEGGTRPEVGKKALEVQLRSEYRDKMAANSDDAMIPGSQPRSCIHEGADPVLEEWITADVLTRAAPGRRAAERGERESCEGEGAAGSSPLATFNAGTA